MRIETKTEFEAWLDANFGLQDVLINALEPAPKTSSKNCAPPSSVKLVCALQVGGSYRAGETRWMRDIEITAQDVSNYCMDWAEGFVAGNCCQEIELVEVKQGLAFTLDVPGTLQVACTSLEILQHPDREEIVQAWFSPNNFSADGLLGKLPTPKDWLNHFHKQGWDDVVWRYHYSDEQALDRVPADYTGWFLQLRSRLTENPQGLFFNHCQSDGGRFSLSLYNYDSALQGLWIEAGKYIATFSEGSIYCGNTVINQAEWLAHLAKFNT